GRPDKECLSPVPRTLRVAAPVSGSAGSCWIRRLCVHRARTLPSRGRRRECRVAVQLETTAPSAVAIEETGNVDHVVCAGIKVIQQVIVAGGGAGVAAGRGTKGREGGAIRYRIFVEIINEWRACCGADRIVGRADDFSRGYLDRRRETKTRVRRI